MRISGRAGKYIAIVAAALAAYLALDVGSCLVWPDVSALAKKNPGKTAMMQLRERQWREAGRKSRLRQQWVPLSRISPYLTRAVLIAEDDKFWRHEGFDFEAMGKALEKDIKKRKLGSGGSTISQQLAKNLYLSPSKNPIRKLKEAILTWRLERSLTKRRILEIYLNVAEWGDGIFGIQAAAGHYYGVPASMLGPEQAARLAAVLPNPRRYNPTGTSRYVAGRSRVIYNIMVRRGIVIPEYDEIMEQQGADTDEAEAGEAGQAGEAGEADGAGQLSNLTGVGPSPDKAEDAPAQQDAEEGSPPTGQGQAP